ncbi:MAG: alanine racemase [Candidatus Cloacimonetes bacterium]|nr:alanine racemase [Candidatus Cloacimonadota bacterium]
MKITKPTLLLDLQKCKNNILRMVDKADKNNLIFRPHFKTHQSLQIGEIFKEFGIDKITVSSVEMAQYFADSGWNDITIAFPFNPLEITEIENLAGKNNLNILISSKDSAEKLMQITHKELNYFIEIDTGYHRSGILAEDILQIEKTITLLKKQHNFIGFLTHSGHTYQANSTDEILTIHQKTIEKMSILKNKFSLEFPELIMSIGDTPSCTLAKDFGNVDEIRPGNFVFFDLMQYNLGVCKFEEIAVCVACPVVDINLERNEVVIYGGGVHLSKEFIMQNGEKNFGQVVKLNETGWQKHAEISYIKALSQEHGIIKASNQLINEISIGDVVGIIPVHSCMIANLMKAYKTLNNISIDHL